MKILVIESSPHKHRLSNLLAEHFIKGAAYGTEYSGCIKVCTCMVY